jgi:hypothetical protein
MHDRAGEVRADLREGGEPARRVAYEDAGIVGRGIAEQQRASRFDFVGAGDAPGRCRGRRAGQTDERDEQIDAHEQTRAQREKLRELSPRHVMILVPPDREVLAPSRPPFRITHVTVPPGARRRRTDQTAAETVAGAR